MLLVLFMSVGTGGLRSAEAATQEQIDTAITNGIAYLLSQQSGDGSFTGDFPPATTGFALTALAHYAEKLGKTPTDATFAYRTQYLNGLNFLFNNVQYDSTNGWVYWDLGGDNTYQTGIPLMAISRSGNPDTQVTTGVLAGYTYKQVGQMVINWLKSAQNAGGAWAYNKGDATRDQSTVGWVTMGVAYAVHSMGCTFPAGFLTGLDLHNTYIQSTTPGGNFGGAGYTSPDGWNNVYKTGHLLFNLALVGKSVNDTTVQNALTFMNSHWADLTNGLNSSADYGWRGNPGAGVLPSYSGMFASAKGFSEYAIDTFSGHNWYNDFADVIVANQNASGWWLGGGYGEQNHTAYVRSTSFALLTLLRAQSHLPPKVTSSAATNITTTTATINGTLTDMGTSTSVDVIFEYGTNSSSLNLTTAPQTFTSAPSNFTVNLTGLSINTTFYYRSKAVGTAGGVSTGTGYSDIVSFTTPDTLTYTPSITNGTSTPSAPISGISPESNNTVYSFSFASSAGYHITGITASPAACVGTPTPASFPYTNDTNGIISGSYNVATPASTSCVVTAATAPNVYSITATATDNNGTANVGGSVSCPATVNYGVDPTCTFTPAAGYHVYDVIVDGSSVWSNFSAVGVNTTLASRALGVVADARTVLVKFRKDTFLITTTPGTNGTISPANSYFDYGTTPTLTVAGDSGYYVVSIGGTCGAAYSNTLPDYNVMSKPYTTNTITAPCSITSSYALGYRYISTSVTPVGNATVTCPASVIHGQTDSCTVTPNSGYHITSVSGCFGSTYTAPAYTNGTSGVTSNTFSLGTVTNDCTVSAVVAINQFDITATPDTHSKVDSYALNTPHTYSNINYNSSQAVTFTSDTGYHLTGITNNCSGTGSATYSDVVNGPWTTSATFTPSGTITNGVADNCGISAVSAINVYSITPSVVIVP
ncbi:MAG: hypothetical protein PHQ58_22405, partial [Rhodoferax sp.]|uniref:InlB B-repeat-containing protein n=1 Tax=Rhodoferax sp. TaxID=50421 RepID=UPI00260BC75F